MNSWANNNRSAGDLRKVFTVNLRHSSVNVSGDTFYVAVDLNTETWRWDANIHIGSRPLELPDAPDLSTRTPTRAAGKALEYLLERADRDDLPK